MYMWSIICTSPYLTIGILHILILFHTVCKQISTHHSYFQLMKLNDFGTKQKSKSTTPLVVCNSLSVSHVILRLVNTFDYCDTSDMINYFNAYSINEIASLCYAFLRSDTSI